MVTRTRCVCGQASVLLALLLVPSLVSAETGPAPTKKRAAQNWESVEMFAAMEAGDIAVKFVAKSDRQAQIQIKNNTDRALSVRLPEAFAGVPVAAQFLNGLAGGNSRNQRKNKQPQVVGSGLGPNNANGGANQFNNLFNQHGVNNNGQNFNQAPGFNRGPGFPGANFFNIAPEGEGKFLVETLCLEHGKPNPRSSVRYEIKKIESVSTDPALQELLKRFGRSQGQMDHEAAQAAAWHLADHLSWKELADKRLEHANGASERYFSAAEIQAAKKLVEQAGEPAKPLPAQPSSRTVSRTR